MIKVIALLILLSLAAPVPVHAEIGTDLDPVEKTLIDKQKQLEKKRLEDDMNKEYRQKQDEQPIKQTAKTEIPAKSGSSWWKWTIGIIVVGGIAAAAGGGSKDHDSSSSNSNSDSGSNSGSGSGGTATVHW